MFPQDILEFRPANVLGRAERVRLAVACEIGDFCSRGGTSIVTAEFGIQPLSVLKDAVAEEGVVSEALVPLSTAARLNDLGVALQLLEEGFHGLVMQVVP